MKLNILIYVVKILNFIVLLYLKYNIKVRSNLKYNKFLWKHMKIINKSIIFLNN